MKPSQFRTLLNLLAVLVMLSPASPSFAQQPNTTAPVAAPVTAAPSGPATAPAAGVAMSPAASQAMPMPADAGGSAADNTGKALKGVATSLRDLSPWSMFLSADIIVKAVMIGLAFASVVTWTVFIAKMIELSIARRKVRSALERIDEARSLAEAQMALG